MGSKGVDIIFVLPAFALVCTRLAGLVMTAPVLSSRMIPIRVRAAVALALTVLVFPMVDTTKVAQAELIGIFAGMTSELLIGAAVGLALAMFISIGEFAGFLVGQQAGLALGQVVDPTQNAQASVIGQVYTVAITIVFLLAGGHRAVILAILESYAVIPVFTQVSPQSVSLLMVETLTAAMTVGLRLAAPAMITLLIVLIGLSVLSRTIPQLNILSVGFSFKVLAAFAVCSVAVATGSDVIVSALHDVLMDIRETLGLEPNPVGLVMTWL